MHRGKVVCECEKCGHELEIPVRSEGTFGQFSVPFDDAAHIQSNDSTAWCRKCGQYYGVRVDYPKTIGLTLVPYDPNGDLKF